MIHRFVHLINETRCILISLMKIALMISSWNRLQQQHQTSKDLKEVIRCVEVHQREFVNTIDVNSN